MDRNGFTLIELTVIIIVIAILAVIAIPKYIDIREDANKASEDYVVGAIREGLNIYRMGSYIRGQ